MSNATPHETHTTRVPVRHQLDDSAVIGAIRNYRDALERGERPARAVLLERFPEIAAEIAECLDSIELLQGSSLSSDARSRERPEPAPMALGDFQIVREIGRGGMGVVYEATQLSLGRRVALKVLPLAAVFDSKQLLRFKNEALAAAQLHHTNIVPVFSVGTERGVHFYAMQFIDGITIAELVAQLANSSGQAEPDRAVTESKPALDATTIVAALSTVRSERPREFWRHAASFGIQAAEALDHAHQMGIIHRDIKPSNLLCDNHGKLWVTDFGLARFFNPNHSGGDREPFARDLTLTGDILGTIRYMSPEQALAKRVVVDHRTDIYSLGATLYELITLQRAFPGDDRQEILRRIAFDEPHPPRRATPNIPIELETIVLKAMAKNPVDRYATAQELADDLRRFVEDKPIRARRATLAQRTRRWARRHAAVVWAAAAITALIAVGSTLSTLLVWQAMQRVELANDAELRRRDQVQRALHMLSSRVVDDLLTQNQELTREQQSLLSDSLDVYRELVADVGDDAAASTAAATFFSRIASIQQHLGQTDDARSSFATAIQSLEQLVRDEPTAENRRDLATAQFSLGVLLTEQTGKLAEAQSAYEQALRTRRQLVEQFGSNAEFRADLANSLNSLGSLLHKQNETARAEPSLREATELFKELVNAFPEKDDYRWKLAACYSNLASVVKALDRPAEAIEYRRRAVKLGHELVSQVPGDRTYRSHLATTLGNLAQDTLLVERRPQQALEHYDAALELLAMLTTWYPNMPEYQYQRAVNTNHRALALEQLGRVDEAEQEFRRALAMQENLVERFPDSPDYAVSLGGNYCNLAQRVMNQGDRPGALDLCDKAITMLESVVEREPRRAVARRFLRNAYAVRAELRKEEQPAEAARDWERAIELDDGRLKLVLQSSRAISLAASGNYVEGVAAAKSVAIAPDANGEVLHNAAVAMSHAASAASGNDALAEEYATEALKLFREAARRGTTDIAYIKTLKAIRHRADFQELLLELEGKRPSGRD